MPLIAPSHSGIYYGLLVFCVLLGLGLLVLAWRRPQRRQRALRLLASVVAAGALWLTAFPPLRSVPIAPAEAILLTDGYSPDTLRQLRRQLGAGTPVWHYGQAAAPTGARPLASLLTLAEQRPALHRLHVVGRGVAAAALPELGTVPLRLHAGLPFTGLRTALWNQQIALGEALRVEGTVASSQGSKPVWVGLRAAGAIRDSGRVTPGKPGFQLRYQPKMAGRAVYELVLRQGGQQLAAEPVPVEITTAPLPAVLLLTATPSFEFRFLKNYLAEAHYPVALRTGVSRNLAQTDFVNQPAQALDRLTPGLLARYAVVVVDAATLAGLAGAETQALNAAIRAGRLGLLVLAEAASLLRTTPAHADFAVLPRPPAQATTPQILTWPDAPAEARAGLPAQLRPTPAIRPLINGPGQAIVAASRRVGLGFVVVSTVPTTFQWALQGHTPVYASYWHRLLAAAMPPVTAAATWRLAERWPRPQQPLTLHLTASFPDQAPTVRAAGGGPAVRLALRQDARLPEWSTAQFWPGAAGWHTVRGPGKATHAFYVFPDSAWQGPELLARQQALTQRVVTPTTVAAVGPATTLEPWPVAWFFGLFLLAAGYLWLEEKL